MAMAILRYWGALVQHLRTGQWEGTNCSSSSFPHMQDLQLRIQISALEKNTTLGTRWLAKMEKVGFSCNAPLAVMVTEGPRPWGLTRPGSSVNFSSIAQSCLTLCNPTDCSMAGLPVHHQLPELALTHVRRVGDVIQPFHPQSSPSPPAFNLSQGLFK